MVFRIGDGGLEQFISFWRHLRDWLFPSNVVQHDAVSHVPTRLHMECSTLMWNAVFKIYDQAVVDSLCKSVRHWWPCMTMLGHQCVLLSVEVMHVSSSVVHECVIHKLILWSSVVCGSQASCRPDCFAVLCRCRWWIHSPLARAQPGSCPDLRSGAAVRSVLILQCVLWLDFS